MGYFANGASGDDYEQRYCERCVHQKPQSGRGCPVWQLHLAWPCSAVGVVETEVLNYFIPRDRVGNNGQCVMFHKASRKDDDD